MYKLIKQLKLPINSILQQTFLNFIIFFLSLGIELLMLRKTALRVKNYQEYYQN